MKYAQTWFSSANHCPETSLFLLTKAESYFLAPDPPNFQLISRLCAVDLTHAGTARFSSRNEEASSQLVLHFKALQLGEGREMIQQGHRHGTVTGTLGGARWHRDTLLKLLLDALSSTGYKLHNVFKCFGEIAFWVAPSIPVCPVRCREFICISHFYRRLLASLDQEGESSCVEDARKQLSLHLLKDTNLISPHLYFHVKNFPHFFNILFLPLLSLV